MKSLSRVMALAIVLTACMTSPQPASTTPGDPTPTASTTTAATVTTATPAPPATSQPDATWPGEDAPRSFALISESSVEVFEDGSTTLLDVPGVQAAGLIDGELILGLEQASGTWVWPPRPDAITFGAGQSVSLLIGQAAPETSAWFHDVARVDGKRLVLYRLIASETDPLESRMMILDLDSGESREVFTMSTRRDGLSAEEAEALVVDATLASDRIGVLFIVGDGTWVEWYDLEGTPFDRMPDFDSLDGAVLEIEGSGNRVLIGVETELNRLISELRVIDFDSGADGAVITHDVDGEMLRDLAFDGIRATAAIRALDGERIGVLVADVTTGSVDTSHSPVSIVLDES